MWEWQFQLNRTDMEFPCENTNAVLLFPKTTSSLRLTYKQSINPFKGLTPRQHIVSKITEFPIEEPLKVWWDEIDC